MDNMERGIEELNIEELKDEIDRLYEANRPDEARNLLLDAYNKAHKSHNTDMELHVLNELIGHYRQTSERAKLLEIIDKAMSLARTIRDDAGEHWEAGAIDYATTALNAANGYRSIGELELAEALYAEVEATYFRLIEPANSLFAGLYNNMSLMYQEKGEYEQAANVLLKARDVVTVSGSVFETAVVYSNLASTYVAMDKLDLASGYARKAIDLFESIDTYDAHFCAALSALGMSAYRRQEYWEALKLYSKALHIVENTFGRNSQYQRILDNVNMCREHVTSGLELSRQYYEAYGKPMLESQFGEYISQMAIGLVGEGSDCFGYDDETSRDHDWGPEFCIWISDALYEEIGESLSAAYNELPVEFMGFVRTRSARGEGRRGVKRLSYFVQEFTGAVTYEDIDFGSVEEYSLAAITNGEIFFDGPGEITLLRNRLLQGYPEDMRYLILAQDLGVISQNGQYNYVRMLDRGDRVTADMMLNTCIRQIMLLTHHLYNRFAPHDKWLYRSFEELAAGTPVYTYVNKLHNSFREDDTTARAMVQETMEQFGQTVASMMYSMDYISDVESYLDMHTDELVRKAEYSRMNDQELVDRIARAEFAAFDKVENEGGRASCQNDWLTFSVMRKSQYLTWNRTMLLQYIYDFNRELSLGHNLITEKYGRMMESTAPERYEEIKEHFPVLSEQKKMIIEQIVAIQIDMLEQFGIEYPKLAENTRSFHTYEDNIVNTSYETYLRGEISTYSDKMLQLYAAFVIDCAKNGINIAKRTIENTAMLYGYSGLEEFSELG